jgi:putative flavoprotein involved in K+ transport
MMAEPETEHFDVAVVGGGQAGLSVSWHLTQAGVSHVVLERDERMHSWRDQRWDSFSLVTPNWQCRLPGYAYAGGDPDGFMAKEELNAWLDGWLETFQPPLREKTPVLSLRAAEDGFGFELSTSSGPLHADQIVVATGGYHTPAIPRLAERLPGHVVQLHSSQYRNPESLPAGEVLVVGTGQSGSQIAEDLHLAGRRVHLAVGSAPRVARFYRGRDVVAWLDEMGHYAKPVTDQPVEQRYRDRTNHYVTGRGGGHDIDLRAFAQEGMALHGRLVSVVDGRLSFGDDLARQLDAADAVYNGINSAIDQWIAEQGIDAPPPSVYTPTWQPPLDSADSVDAEALSAVVWSTGFRSDYSWLHVATFDGAGHAAHLRGVSAAQGVYFIGLPWQHTWGSGRFAAVAADAEYVVGHLLRRRLSARVAA